MSNVIKFDENMKLPAHLQALQDQGGMDEWGSGQVSGFPVLSIKGKVFHIVRGDEAELITRPDDPDEAAASVQLVILKTHKGVARVFYKEKYEEGSADKPTCYSVDGIKPEDDAEEKQSKQCKTCPHSQWGSRITDAGKKGKACSEVKRVAVAEPGYEDDPMLLRIPPTSLRNWDDYLRKLDKKGIKPPMLVTKVGFDASVSHQLLTFKPVGFVDAASATRIAQMQDNDVVEAIIGAGPAVTPDPIIEEDDEPAPEPKERTRATRKAKEPEPEEDDEEDEPDEKPTRRRRAAPEEAEEKPATRRRRSTTASPKDEEEKPSRRRAAPVDEDEDEPEEKPTTRRRRAEPVEEDEPEEKPRKSAKETATVVDADDDLEDELDDMLGDLDFDD